MKNKLTETPTRTWRCDCSCATYLTFDWYIYHRDEDDSWGFATFSAIGANWRNRKEKVRAIWSILRGEDIVYDDMTLNEQIVDEMIVNLQAAKVEYARMETRREILEAERLAKRKLPTVHADGNMTITETIGCKVA